VPPVKVLLGGLLGVSPGELLEESLGDAYELVVLKQATIENPAIEIKKIIQTVLTMFFIETPFFFLV